MTGGGRFRPTGRVSAREVEGELVLLDLERGEFLVARGLGPRIWDLLVSGRSVREVRDLVTSRYGVDPDRVRADVEAFVRDLRDRGFIEEEPDPPAGGPEPPDGGPEPRDGGPGGPGPGHPPPSTPAPGPPKGGPGP